MSANLQCENATSGGGAILSLSLAAGLGARSVGLLIAEEVLSPCCNGEIFYPRMRGHKFHYFCPKVERGAP